MYYNGTVVPENRLETAKLWERALKLNIYPIPRGWENWSADVEAKLGTMYLYGDGVQQNYDEALRCLTRAASAGDALAQNSLGYMYETGKGVELDYNKAIEWYQKAAAQGYQIAQQNLERIYEALSVDSENESVTDSFTLREFLAN